MHYTQFIPILHRFPASQLLMYVYDNSPPHVHVKLGDGRECLVDIDTLALSERITAWEIRLELAWIEAHTEQLQDYWHRYSE